GSFGACPPPLVMDKKIAPCGAKTLIYLNWWTTTGDFPAAMNRRQRRLSRACPTLSAALDRYLAEVSANKKSHTQEQSVARIWRRTGLVNRNLARVTALDIQRLRDEWLVNRKPGTVNRRLALLSHLYTVARKEWGYAWLANPAQLVTRPVVDDARDRRLFTRI